MYNVMPEAAARNLKTYIMEEKILFEYEWPGGL
jgi:hypothetical protein